ncbi:MAG TPA: murein L,D-transpeptidase catalytic domain family protein [Sphingomonas sp.]|nr:murein L,D-transpeptidase catalytic domain family protein [Sphingomonas sp.]
MLHTDRRKFLAVAALGAGALFVPRPLASADRALAASFVPPVDSGPTGPLFAHARTALAKHAAHVDHDDVVGLADFSPASRAARLHLVDLKRRKVTSYLVAHGRGSDPAHTGYLHRFSNDPGSNCTSEGAYRTGDYYTGAHGRSMRLKGLEATNSNAESRAIVVHGAWYVSDEMVREHGMLGRSEGCLAVAEADLPAVLDALGPGRLIVAGKFT